MLKSPKGQSIEKINLTAPQSLDEAELVRCMGELLQLFESSTFSDIIRFSFARISEPNLNMDQNLRIFEQDFFQQLSSSLIGTDSQRERLIIQYREEYRRAILAIGQLRQHEINQVNFSKRFPSPAASQPFLTLINCQRRYELFINFIKLSSLDRSFVVCASNSAFLLNWLGFDFNDQSLRGITLEDTDLSGGNFVRADLSHSKFNRVNINGCDFTAANLNFIQWERIISCEIAKYKASDCKLLRVISASIGWTLLLEDDTKVRLFNLKTQASTNLLSESRARRDCSFNGKWFSTVQEVESLNSSGISSDDNENSTKGYSQLNLWDFERLKIQKSISGNSDSFSQVKFQKNKNGCLAALIKVQWRRKGSLYLWNIRRGAIIRKININIRARKVLGFSLNDSLVALKQYGQIVEFWDIARGTSYIKRPYQDKEKQKKYSPNFKLMYTFCRRKNLIHVWDLESDKLNRTIICDCQLPSGKIAFSSSEQFLAMEASDHIQLIDFKTGKLLQQLSGHEEGLQKLLFSPEGQILISFDFNSQLRVWNPNVPKSIRDPAGHASPVCSVQFVQGDSNVISLGYDGVVKHMSIQYGSQKDLIEGQVNYVSSLAVSNNGLLFASGRKKHIIQICHTDGGKVVQNLKGHTDYVMSIAFSSDGLLLASGCLGSIIRIWEIESAQQIRRFNANSGSVNSLIFAADRRFLVSGSLESIIQVWDLITGCAIQKLHGHSDAINQVIFADQELYLVSGSSDSTVKIWDRLTGKLVKSLDEHSAKVNSVAFCEQHRILASGSADQSIRLWRLSDWSQLQVIDQIAKPVLSIAFSASGSMLISGNADGNLQLWDIVPTCKAKPSQALIERSRTMACAGDGLQVAVRYSNKQVCVSRLKDGAWSCEFLDNQSDIECLQFCPKSAFISAGGSDGTIRIWDLETLKVSTIFKSDSSPIIILTYTHDGSYLASCSQDNFVRIWGVDSKLNIFTLHSSIGEFALLAFSLDGKMIIGFDKSTQIECWWLASGESEKRSKTFCCDSQSALKLYGEFQKLYGAENLTVGLTKLELNLEELKFEAKLRKVFSRNRRLNFLQAKSEDARCCSIIDRFEMTSLFKDPEEINSFEDA